MNSEVRLRPAEPTFEDGHLYAKYLEYATEGLFRILLGRGYAKVIAAAFHDPNHDMSYQNATFAMRDNRVVGLLSAYSGTAAERHRDQPLMDAAGIRIARIVALAALARPLINFMRQVPDTDYYIAALATNENERGKGIGSMMLEEAERRGRAMNMSRLALDVSITNGDGIRFYERTGLVIEATSPRIFLGANWSVHRMVKTL